MNHVGKNRTGFTLIELMLAMSFISVLLIAIALTVIQISNVYNRGITLKDVNQAGRSISAELNRSISQSSLFNIDSGDDSQFIVQGDWGGRLCVGQYSYIWNYGKYLEKGDKMTLNLYQGDDTSSSDTSIPIPRFVKALDPGASYCRDSSKKIDPDSSVELLNVGEHNLALHKFTISSSPTATDSKTNQRLYSIEFVLGTNDQDALNYESDIQCKPPSQEGADANYCSVNIFDLVVRAGSAVE